jgi:hypothetical protein
MSSRCPFVLFAASLFVACSTGITDGASDPDAAAPTTADAAPNLPAPRDAGADRGSGFEACNTASDCESADACKVATCSGRKCVYAPKCKTADECSPQSCDPGSGQCVSAPLADGASCGPQKLQECKAGRCEEPPKCFGRSPTHYLHCGGGAGSYRDLDTSLYGVNLVDTYACGGGEIGNEVALEFDPAPGQNVMVTLAVTDGSNADLDLFVLEGDCNKKAACAAHSATPGTGNESASFTAQAGKTYYVVVDGKTTNRVGFHVEVSCN